VGYWGSSESEIRRLRETGLGTGDLGRVCEDGKIALMGRTDSLVKIRGLKVSLPEVEEVLNSHPCVAESAVIAVEDPNAVTTSQLKGFVVLNENGTTCEKDLIRYCKEGLELFKVPESIEFISKLPKSSSGKLLRNMLKV